MAKSLEAAKSIKLNEAIPFAQKYASEHLTAGKLQGRFNRWYESYREKYIDAGSPAPIYQIIGYGTIASYLIALPAERRHLRHEQEAKLKGEHH